MTDQKVLLFARDTIELTRLATALRLADFVVLTPRFHELAIDALVRAEPRLVLVPAEDAAAAPPAFMSAAAAAGIRIYTYGAPLHGDTAASTLPRLSYEGDPNALVEELTARLQAQR